MIKDLFTVVLTVWRREHLLPYALQSLLWQTHPDLEVLIYCDGPSPVARKIVQCFENQPKFREHLRYVEVLPRAGFFGNHLRELGSREAQGEFITFLSHDSFFHPDFCKAHAVNLRKQPCISVVPMEYWKLATDGTTPIYVGRWPRREPQMAVLGEIDAHNLAYPTDFLQTHVQFEEILPKHFADFCIFDQLRGLLPVVFDAEEHRTLSVHF